MKRLFAKRLTIFVVLIFIVSLIYSTSMAETNAILIPIAKLNIIKTIKGYAYLSQDSKKIIVTEVDSKREYDYPVILWKGQKTFNGRFAYLSPDEMTVIVSEPDDNLITLYDAVSGQIIKTFKGNYAYFLPDGKIIGVSDYEASTVTLYDITGVFLNDELEKGEFETTKEYEERLRRWEYTYSSFIALGKYDADRGGFETKVKDMKFFVPVPRDKAKEIVTHKDKIRIELKLKYFDSQNVQLVSAQLVNEASKERFTVYLARETLDIAQTSESTITYMPKSEVKKPESLYESAQIDFKEKRYAEARQKFKKFINDFPTHAVASNAYFWVGEAYYADKRYEDAILAHETFLKRYPDHAMAKGAMLKQAFAFVQIGDRKTGKALFEKVVKRYPNSREAELAEKKIAELTYVYVPKPEAPAENIHAIPDFKATPIPADLAIIIGIENYQGLPKSDYSQKDASIIKDYLKALGFAERNIELITDEKATRSSIEKAIEAWLPNRIKKDSRVIVYYSGHGASEPKTGDAYIVPHDGDPNYLEVTGYSLKRLYDKLGKLQVKEVIVLLDSCFSGAGGRSVLAKGARPLVMMTSSAVIPQNMAVFSATQGSQISTSSPEKGHGVFTYYFLKALKEGKKNIAEIYEYIKPLVEDEAKQLNVQQSPSISPDAEKLKGRFILRR